MREVLQACEMCFVLLFGMGLLWLGALQLSGGPVLDKGSFGLGRFFLSLCRILVWLGVVVLGFGCR